MAVDTKIGKLDLEELKKKDNLTEEETAQIAEAAAKESEREEQIASETEDEKVIREKKEKEDADVQVKEELGNRAKEVGLEPGATEEEVKAKEIELGKHTETEEEKAEREQKVQEAQKDKEKADKEKEETFKKEIETFASENKVSQEDARKELEHIQKVGEKYQNDPKKLSRTVLHLQRDLVKTQEQLKEKAKPAPLKAEQIPIEVMVKNIEEGKITSNGKPVPKEQILQGFREHYPDFKDLDDDKVIKLAAKELREKFIESDKNTLVELDKQAKTKREELLSNLSEEDKVYIPDIQPVLEKTPSEVVLQEGYSLSDFILWAKGKTLETKVNEAYERGLKRGKEEAKIVAQKPPIGDGKPPVETKSDDTKINALTGQQKERALSMYDVPGMSDKEKYLAYIDYIESEKQK